MISIFTNNNAWTNWGLNQKCTPKEIIKPNSKTELINFIKKAKKEKSKVRVVASGHSWSDIVCNDGYLVDIGNLNKILNVDRKNKTVKVEAGITVCELNKALVKEDLALSNQSAIDLQTIAGTTATATHGTGHTGTLSSFINKVELITSDGKIHELSKTKNENYLKAARVNIGSLGIVSAIELQCEPLFTTKNKHLFMNLETIIKAYQEYHKKNDFFLFTWDPYKNFVAAYFENKIYPKNMKAKKMSETCFQGIKIGEMEMRRQEVEIAIPVEKLSQALKRLNEFFKMKSKENIKIFGEVLCRFVNADKNSLLSPTFDRDSVYISINAMPTKSYDYKKFLKEYEDILVNEFNGRPHWGKINFLDYNKAKKLYGKNLDEFIKIRNQLDPVKMFSNSFTKRVLKD